MKIKHLALSLSLFPLISFAQPQALYLKVHHNCTPHDFINQGITFVDQQESTLPLQYTDNNDLMSSVSSNSQTLLLVSSSIGKPILIGNIDGPIKKGAELGIMFANINPSSPLSQAELDHARKTGELFIFHNNNFHRNILHNDKDQTVSCRSIYKYKDNEITFVCHCP